MIKIEIILHTQFGGRLEIRPTLWFLLPSWKTSLGYKYKTKIPTELIEGDDRDYIDSDDRYVYGHERFHLVIHFLCFVLSIPYWKRTMFYKYQPQGE